MVSRVIPAIAMRKADLSRADLKRCYMIAHENPDEAVQVPHDQKAAACVTSRDRRAGKSTSLTGASTHRRTQIAAATFPFLIQRPGGRSKVNRESARICRLNKPASLRVT
jgi:hypothetical protein